MLLDALHLFATQLLVQPVLVDFACLVVRGPGVLVVLEEVRLVRVTFSTFDGGVDPLVEGRRKFPRVEALGIAGVPLVLGPVVSDVLRALELIGGGEDGLEHVAEVDEELSSLDVIKLLLAKGAEVNIQLKAQQPYRTKLDRGTDGIAV